MRISDEDARALMRRDVYSGQDGRRPDEEVRACAADLLDARARVRVLEGALRALWIDQQPAGSWQRNIRRTVQGIDDAAAAALEAVVRSVAYPSAAALP